MPTHLNEMAAAEWHRIVPDLVRDGRVNSTDRAMLAAYCVAWSRWVEAEEEIEVVGMVIQTQSGYPMAHPYVSISKQSFGVMEKIAGEFGFTPSARKSDAIPIAPPAASEPDKKPFQFRRRIG